MVDPVQSVIWIMHVENKALIWLEQKEHYRKLIKAVENKWTDIQLWFIVLIFLYIQICIQGKDIYVCTIHFLIVYKGYIVINENIYHFSCSLAWMAQIY